MITSEARRVYAKRHWIDRLPMLVVLVATFALAMIVPAIYAAANGQHEVGRPFLYAGIVFLVLAVLVGFATQSRPKPNEARSLLLALLAAYLLLPLILALPLAEAVQGLSYRSAYFEMVSSITTTGATVFDLPERIPDAVHLWRAQVAWMGGFLIWLAAISILAPMRLGGIEVLLTDVQIGRNANLGRSFVSTYKMRHVQRHLFALLPVYVGLTFALWLALMTFGEAPFIALCHAMSTLSTSGISPVGGLHNDESGRIGEVLVMFFLVFALSRVTFARDMPAPLHRPWYGDPELRLATVLILVVPAAMFLFHFLAAIEIKVAVDPIEAVRSYWGNTFTTVSFLTTTGFISNDWDASRGWSGLGTPGMILMGLALVGGGVATTAGGVKLLRVYALYKQGRFEMARLVHPNLVANPGHKLRRVKPASAYVAWLFFMIYGLTLAACVIALSLTGTQFETSMILTVAALSNTGPLTAVAGDAPIMLAQLNASTQIVVCIAMVFGRLETLAIVALMNPEFWR